ncbi:MAG TPA: GNAT family N-acetyltransferase [Anaerolineales bacterium]|nr:GNAT family N-acetyltransferase [Anaerolineales bacterium]
MPSPVLPVLRTDRLILRPFRPEDAADVQRLAGHPDIASTTANIPHPYAAGVAEAWIATHEERFAHDEAAIFAVTLASTGDLLGSIGLEIRREHERAELGYWIGVPYWHQGYATEAGARLLRFAFEDLRLQRVFAIHFDRNPASGRVMQKLGMKREGRLRHHMVKNGRAEDVSLWGILAADVPSRGESIDPQ